MAIPVRQISGSTGFAGFCWCGALKPGRRPLPGGEVTMVEAGAETSVRELKNMVLRRFYEDDLTRRRTLVELLRGAKPLEDSLSLSESFVSPDTELLAVFSTRCVTCVSQVDAEFRSVEGDVVLIIPDGTSEIRDRAFSGCQKIQRVTMPDSIKLIGRYAFSHCSGLVDISIPSSVTAIGEKAFLRLGLRSLTIPSSVASIGDAAFALCSSLTTLTICNGVTSIGDRAFNGCSSLSSLSIPSSVSSMGEFAFGGCISLTSLTIGSGTTSIPVRAFDGCCSLTQLTIPSSVTQIQCGAFQGCMSLTDLAIPSSVTSIEDMAFSGCSALPTLTLPESVTCVSQRAFEGCSSLVSLNVPAAVFGDRAFDGCRNLRELAVPADTSLARCFAGCPSTCKVVMGEREKELGPRLELRKPIGCSRQRPSCSNQGSTVHGCAGVGRERRDRETGGARDRCKSPGRALRTRWTPGWHPARLHLRTVF